MSLIVGERIDKYYGAHDVFRGISFRVEAQDRIGLVGPNGEGKTTLLRLMAGLEEPTSGSLTVKRGLRIGYLPQDPSACSATTLWESMLAVFAEVRAVESQLHAVAARLADDAGSRDLLDQYSALQADLERRGGYAYENRIRSVLSGLGFGPGDYGQPLAQLSGGQRTRALLGRLLLEEPELLLLDEPTNHLDLDAVEWLEGWLLGFKGSLVVVSHDRYLLNAVTQRTWEMALQRLEVFRGSYGAYVQQREARYRERLRQWEEQQEYIATTEEFIRRYIAGQRSREAQGRRTRLERFLREEAIPRPQQPAHIRVRLDPHRRSGDIVARLEDVVVGYAPERPLLRLPTVEVRRGMRVGVVGPNGAGKTTLVRTLLGDLPPLAGTVRLGAQVVVGYLSQTHDYLDPDSTVLEALLAARPGLGRERARTLLASFLFTGDDVFKTVAQLSGGQRSRVALARLAVQDANLLVLDEPTNHLDIASQEILQEALQSYGGTLLLVSHDRYLIEGLATHVWVVTEGTVAVIEGGWAAYLAWRDRSAPAAAAAEPAPTPAQLGREAQKQLRRERKQLERLGMQRSLLEEQIQQHEEQLAQLSARIGAAGQARDMVLVHDLGREYRDAEKRLEGLWADWEALTETLEAGAAPAAAGGLEAPPETRAG